MKTRVLFAHQRYLREVVAVGDLRPNPWPERILFRAPKETSNENREKNKSLFYCHLIYLQKTFREYFRSGRRPAPSSARETDALLIANRTGQETD